MLQQVLTAYHRFAKRTGKARKPVSLNVLALEERSTPAASFVPLVALPQTVQVAPAHGAGSLAIPMPGQSIVRLDVFAAGDSSQAEQPEESVFTAQPRHDADIPPVAQPEVAVSDEELAEFLAAQAEG